MKRLVAIIVATFLLTMGAVIPSNATDERHPGGLSDYGAESVADLTTCLQTADSLDVFYLVDRSESLRVTDENKERASIIEQDVRRWGDIGTLRPGLRIRVAGAFFSQTTSELSDWVTIDGQNSGSVAKQFRDRIKNEPLQSYTNWEAGLQAAFNKVSKTNANCKTIIWFTDGGIWPGEPRDRSTFDSLESLCGTPDNGKIPTSTSSSGLMVQIRTAQIHLFGILLHDTSKEDTEPNEDFYRSMMLPILEESGKVEKFPGLPSGEMICGEMKSSDERDYATGAFLEAESAADVAFAFMTIPASVNGGSSVGCQKSGEFYVDPGISQVEFFTEARSWTITDSEGKVVQRSNASSVNARTTGRVNIPDVKTSETWKFNPEGNDGKCSLYVYPDLYLELHDKSLFTGRESSITGQFVHSLSSGEKAKLDVFKSSDFEAEVDGKVYPSSLSRSSGAFEISNFVPGPTEAKVRAKLELETQHYKLEPIIFEATEKVYPAEYLPEVGKIAFSSDLNGARSPALATAVIKVPVKAEFNTRICFETPQVIGDIQDESAGKATDRSKNWVWSTSGLDSQGCLDILRGTNKDQKVTFSLMNAVQAESSAEALFEYTISSSGLDQPKEIPDSQTAKFESHIVKSGGLFWFYFILFLILGLAVPFGILTVFNLKNARLTIGVDTIRGEFKMLFDPQDRSMVFAGEHEGLGPEEIQRIFLPLSSSSKGTKKEFLEPDSRVMETDLKLGTLRLSAKAPLWPLSKPMFKAEKKSNQSVFLVNSAKDPSSGWKLNSGSLSSLRYAVVDPDEMAHSKRYALPVPVTIVVYSKTINGSRAHLDGDVSMVHMDSTLKEQLKLAFDELKIEQETTTGGVGIIFGGSPGGEVSGDSGSGIKFD